MDTLVFSGSTLNFRGCKSQTFFSRVNSAGDQMDQSDVFLGDFWALKQWKKGPWLFRVYRVLYSPLIRGSFHKPLCFRIQSLNNQEFIMVQVSFACLYIEKTPHFLQGRRRRCWCGGQPAPGRAFDWMKKSLHKRRQVWNLLGQWLNFKLFGITYLVGKIKFKLFFRVPFAKWENASFFLHKL